MTWIRLYDPLEVRESGMGDTRRACRVVTVASGLLRNAALEQENAPSPLRRRERGAETRVAATDDDDIRVESRLGAHAILP